jgi:hypothetical protein
MVRINRYRFGTAHTELPTELSWGAHRVQPTQEQGLAQDQVQVHMHVTNLTSTHHQVQVQQAMTHGPTMGQCMSFLRQQANAQCTALAAAYSGAHNP